jgi:hypothetical protein
MVLMKHLNSLPSTESFYQMEQEKNAYSQRLDDARIANIIVVKMITYLNESKNANC